MYDITEEEIVLKYKNSQNLDELFLHFSDSISISSFSLLSNLNLPNDSKLTLWFKSIIKKKYSENFYIGLFQLISICYLFVFHDIKAYLIDETGLTLGAKEYDDLFFMGATYFPQQLNIKGDKNEMFENIMAGEAIEVEDFPPSDKSEWIDRIIRCYESNFNRGIKIDKKTFASFTLPIISNQHIKFIHPFFFVEKYKNLKNI